MHKPRATLHRARKVALLALSLTLPACAHVRVPHGVHFAVTLKMRYGATMHDDRLMLDYSFGLGPEDMHSYWLSELEALLRHAHKPVAGPSEARL